MKVAINKCYGGFSISAFAVARLAELQGRECYFFNHQMCENGNSKFIPIAAEECEKFLFWHAFDIPNHEILCQSSSDE